MAKAKKDESRPEGETGFEDLLDRVITVPDAELQDYGAVAKKIGLYVASCMKERRAFMSGKEGG